MDKLIKECKEYDRLAAQNGIHQVSFYSMLIIHEERKTQAKLSQVLKGMKSINKQLAQILKKKEVET